MENEHVFQRRLNIAIGWDVINRMSVIYPIIKGRLIRTREFQNVFRFDILIFIGIIVWRNWRIKIAKVLPRPQSLWIIEIPEL